MTSDGGLRELSRQAVRARIAEVAEGLFIERGFEATTVDDIAEAVGMSQRTFFRYFASKEDAVLDGYERDGGEVVSRLAAQPIEECDWDSLRICFEVIVEQFDDPKRRERSIALQRIVAASPALLAANLEKTERLQERLVEVLSDRAAERGESADSLVIRAVVGSALSCLRAVLIETPGTRAEFAERLDTAMTALRPLHDSLALVDPSTSIAVQQFPPHAFRRPATSGPHWH